MNLKGERVMVAGGAGFIGSQLTRELLEDGANVSVYDNFLHGTRANLLEIQNDIQIICGDITDEWKLTRAFRDIRPKYVFDLVGDTYVPTAYDVPKRFFRINVEGTINILMVSQLYGVQRVLYVSSTEVYGEARSVPMNESHAYDPLNTYAVSKLAADRVCFTFQREHGVPVVIARIYNSYGPRETEPYVIAEIITQMARGDILQLGNIEAKRDFTYVEDTARGLIAVMGSNIPDGEAVNVGSNQVHSPKDLVALIAKIMGKRDVKIQIDPKRLRKLDIDLFQCDYSKLQKVTGWKPKVGMQEGLERTVEWFNANGRRWSWEEWTDGARVYDAAG